jgi:hypothetical protein
MALGKIARAKSLPQTKNRGQRLTLTIVAVYSEFTIRLPR